MRFKFFIFVLLPIFYPTTLQSQRFECMSTFLLSRACIVTDLTPIVTIDRRVGWTYPPALPKWEGG